MDKINKIKIKDVTYEIGGGGSATVDSGLSTTSENAVQNKVITSELEKKLEDVSISDEYVTGISNTLYYGQTYLKVQTNKTPNGVNVNLPYIGNNLTFDSITNNLHLKNGDAYDISQVDLSPLKGTKASVSGDTLILA